MYGNRYYYVTFCLFTVTQDGRIQHNSEICCVTTIPNLTYYRTLIALNTNYHAYCDYTINHGYKHDDLSVHNST